jgi:hypothetical protein
VHTLHIDLRDGFDQDDVIFYVNNREAARLIGVTTNLTVLQAAALDVLVPEGRCALCLDVPKQNISASIDVDAVDTPYVAIFVRKGVVEFHTLREAMPIL